MGVLRNNQWEKFAQNINAGMNQTDAYEAAGYKARGEALRVNAAKLLTNTTVIMRVRELAEQSADASILTGKERRLILSAIARGERKASFVTREGIFQDIPAHGDMNKALELLAKMDGDLAPVKIEISARIQTRAQDWVGRVLSTVASVLGDEAAEKLLPHLPVLELEA